MKPKLILAFWLIAILSQAQVVSDTNERNLHPLIDDTMFSISVVVNAASYEGAESNGFSTMLANPIIENITTANSGIYILKGVRTNDFITTVTSSVQAGVGSSICPNTISASCNSPVCIGNTIQLSAISSGGGTMNFAWSGPNGFSASTSAPTINAATVLASGIYSVTASGGRNCIYTATTSVFVKPNGTASSNSPICSGSTLNLSATGGSIYAWSGPNGFTASTSTPSISGAITSLSGSYSVTVISGTCVSTAAVNVMVSNQPTVTASSNSPICSGSTLNLSGTGGSSYNWAGPSGFTASGATPTLTGVSMLASGIYSVTVSNGSCSATASTSVVVNAVPTATASSNSPICSGSTLNLTATGGSSYNWAGPSGFTASGATPTIAGATTLASGIYSVTAVSGSCTATTSTSVVVNSVPVATASSNSPICTGSTLNLTATGGSSYNWAGPSGFTASGATPTITGVSTSQTGIYSVTVISGTCTATATASTSVVVNALPVSTANSNSPICSGGTLNLSGTGGSAYTWSGPNGFTASGATPTVAGATTLASGIYSVTAVSGSCTATTSTSVVVNAVPVATASSNSPICSGSTLNLSGTGGSAYTWSGPSGFTASGATPTITGVSTSQTGVYSVTAVSGSCIATATTSVVVNSIPSATASSNSPICSGSTLNLSGTGGSSYNWAGPSGFTASGATPALTGVSILASGIYTVTVNDGCTVSQTISVSIKPLPSASVASNNPVCIGGILNLSATGGGSYAWAGPNAFANNGATPTISNVSPAQSGIYSVTVTGTNICTATTTISVIVQSNPTLITNVPFQVVEGAQIALFASGAVTYEWSGPNGFSTTVANPVIQNVTTANGGIYVLKGMGANGCTATVTNSVQIIGCGILLSASSNSPVCIGNTIQLSATSAGRGAINYKWSGPNSFSSILKSPIIANATNVMQGIYSVTGKTEICQVTATISVKVQNCSSSRVAAEDTEAGDGLQLDISPNPTDGKLKVAVTIVVAAPLTLYLTDALGRKVGEWHLNEVRQYHETELSLDNQSVGVYILRAEADKRSATKKVVRINR